MEILTKRVRGACNEFRKSVNHRKVNRKSEYLHLPHYIYKAMLYLLYLVLMLEISLNILMICKMIIVKRVILFEDI